MQNKILVSVCSLTYNHVNYIKQCLDGFLMQQTNFEFELLIHDDASTDGTTTIIREYEKKYPNLIKPIYQNENQYSKGGRINIKYNFPRAKGKYIALCEGDDYWTDPLKLQKQVDFLEANGECSLCFHPTTLKIEGAPRLNSSMYKSLEQREYKGEEIIENWIIPTASVVFKSKSLLPVFFNRMRNPNYIYGDIILFLSLAETGTLFCLNDSMSVYRRHEKGVTQDKVDMNFYEKLYKHRESIANDFNGKYSYLKKEELSKCYFSLSLYYLKNLKIKGVKLIIKALWFDKTIILSYIINKFSLKKTS